MVRVQVIFGCVRALKRPIVFVAPLVRAHYENAHGLFGELVLCSFKQIVVPGERDAVFVEFGGSGAEIDCSDVPSSARMASDGDQQVLPVSGRSICRFALEALKIAQRSILENVVPGGDSQSRNGELGVVIFYGPTFPVVVEVRMRQPIDEVGREVVQVSIGVAVEQRVRG